MRVVFLVTLDTKQEQADYLNGLLSQFIEVETINLSTLESITVADASVPVDREKASQLKIEKVNAVVEKVKLKIKNFLKDSANVANPICGFVGMGGGTGSQMIANIFSDIPVDIPKVLLSPFPNDPRHFLVSNNIVLVPSVCDLIGLNKTVRQGIQNTVDITTALVKGFQEKLLESFKKESKSQLEEFNIGVTALGVTEGGVQKVCEEIKHKNYDFSVFHSNGFGGYSFVRWIQAGMFSGVVDYTIHEITMLLFGDKLDTAISENRFSAVIEHGVPQVCLPGAANFHTRFRRKSLDKREGKKENPKTHFYEHSRLVRHVALSRDELAEVGAVWAKMLNFGLEKRSLKGASAMGETTVLFPMAGFSSEDRAGGVIENLAGREALMDSFREVVSPEIKTVVLNDVHINDSLCGERATQELMKNINQYKTESNRT